MQFKIIQELRRSDLLETEFLESSDDHGCRSRLHVPAHEDETVHQGLDEVGVVGEVVPPHLGAGQGVHQAGQGGLEEVGDVRSGGEEAGENSGRDLQFDITVTSL